MKSSGIAKLPSNKPWLRLADIAENAQHVLEYTFGMNFETFVANRLARDATERCITRISEAAVKLGPFAEELLPAHDWASIRGIGNVLRHDYDQLSLSVIWDSVSKHLPPLLTDVDAVLAARSAEES